jgi:hypothetical protein
LEQDSLMENLKMTAGGKTLSGIGACQAETQRGKR